MTRLFVIGSLAYDRIMVFPGRFKDHFLPDELHNINLSFAVGTPKEGFGGCGGNIAYSLALLGGVPEILSTAGNDFGRYEEWLKENGIATTSIQIYGDTPTASAYIMTDEGDNQIAAFSLGADGLPYTLETDLSQGTLAIVSPTGVEDMRLFPERFRDAGVPFVFDPGQQIPRLSSEELRGGMTRARAVIVNDYELALVKEKTGWSEDDIVAHAEMLIVTLGEKGSRVYTKSETYDIAPVPATEVLDPTGAGDAYRAGLLHGLSQDLSVKDACQLGSTVAAYAVECYGTQNHRFTLEELRKRYEATYGTYPL